MTNNQSSQHKWLQIMQTKEPIQGWIIHAKRSPNKLNQIRPYPWGCTKQISNHRCTPKTHLTPWLTITNKSRSDHNNKDLYSLYPKQSSRLPIRTIKETSCYMLINKNKKERSAISMEITKLPTHLNITHDMFDALKSQACIRNIMAGQLNSCNLHYYLIQTQLRSKTPKIRDISSSWRINQEIIDNNLKRIFFSYFHCVKLALADFNAN